MAWNRKEFGLLLVFYINLCFLGHIVNCQSKPRLEILPVQAVQKKPIGQSLLLTCRPIVPDVGLVTDLQWRDKNNMTVHPKSSEYIPKYDSDGRRLLEPKTGLTPPGMYSEVLPGDQSLALIINKLTETMTGTYFCTASYANTELLEISVRIETFVAITWKNAPLEQYLTVGKSQLVYCEVTATPPPSVDWLRNGDPIKTGEHFVVQTTGLFIRDVQESDDGIYTCRAVVVQTGELVERHIRVEVQIKPKIDLLPEIIDAVEEKPFSIQCNATGKPVPEYTWVKDLAQQNVVNIDRFSVNAITGQMNIQEVTKDHYGYYTCIAKNIAGEDQSKMLLNVLLRPRIFEFYNITVPQQTEAEIICKATGRPAPLITFRRWGSDEEFVVGSNNDIYLEQKTDEELAVSTGTLRFTRINRTDDGLYECVARNKGEVAYKVGHITVEYPPNFDTIKGLPPVYSWAEKRANLSCLAQGFPNATIEWRRDGRLITELGDPFLLVEGAGPRSDLLITPKALSYYRAYKCIAMNKLGKAEHDMELRQGFIPEEVAQAKPDVVTATSITFNIIGPATPPGLPILAYTVQYMESIHPDWTNAFNRTWSPDSPYVVEGLRPEKNYHFRFAARNQVGLGRFGPPVVQLTPRRSEPASPQIIIHDRTTDENEEENLVYSQYSDHYALSWSIPPDNGEPITYYRVKYCPGLKVDNIFNQIEHLCATKDVLATDPTEYRMTDLQSLTYYSVELMAHNAIGFSHPSSIMLKTAQGTDMVIRVDSQMLSSAAIIGIAVGSVLLLIVIIDFICCMLLNAGIMATLCRKTKRSPSDLDDETRIGSGQLIKEPPPSPLPLPPPVKLGGTPLTTPLEENEPLNAPMVTNGNFKNSSSVEFDGRVTHSRSGEIIGKNSAV